MLCAIGSPHDAFKQATTCGLRRCVTACLPDLSEDARIVEFANKESGTALLKETLEQSQWREFKDSRPSNWRGLHQSEAIRDLFGGWKTVTF